MMQLFLAGCGRSGTSYLRTLIDAHPSVYIPSESLFIIDYLRNEPYIPERVWRRMLAREPQLLCWHTGSVPEGFDIADTLKAIHLSAARHYGASVWGQKTPRFIRQQDLLNKAFPGSRWILIHRDPRAVAASMKQSGQHTSCIPLAVRRWRQDNSTIVALARGTAHDSSTLVIAYTDLVSSRKTTLAEAWRHIGLDPITDDEVATNARPVFFNRSAFPNNTIREGVAPDNTALERWRTTLSPLEQSYIENACRLEMEALGYAPELHSVRSPNTLSHLWLWLQAIRDVKIIVRYLRYWPEYPVRVLQRKLLFWACRLWYKLRNYLGIPPIPG